MKHLVHLYLVVALAVGSILLSARKLALFDRLVVLKKSRFLRQADVDLVVFGDSWSDSSVYLTSRSRIWTEHLCALINCRYRSYAHMRLENLTSSGHLGTVVENSVHERTGLGHENQSIRPADLKAQLWEWSKQNHIDKMFAAQGAEELLANGIIFAFDFGLWDTWQAATKDKHTAEYIVKASTDVIFQALDYLSGVLEEQNPAKVSTVKAILPYIIDLTFLPGYSEDVETTRRTVDLVRQWNGLLVERAGNWDKGELLIYDMHSFMIDHIRATQMIAVDRLDLASQDHHPVFSNVEAACIDPAATGERNGESRCSVPNEYLFWDDVHLGAKAHTLIAEEILMDVKSLADWV